MKAKIIRGLSTLLFALALHTNSDGQTWRPSRVYVEPDGWSLGFNIGKTDMWGDVGTNSFVDHFANSKYFDKVSFVGGLFGRYTFHPALSVRFGINYGSLYATDAWNYDGVMGAGLTEGKDYVQRYLRSQTAKTSIVEMFGMIEFTPRRFNIKGRAYKRRQPYIAAGIAAFHYTPYSTVGNGTTWIKTYDLRLEGQGFGPGYPKLSARIQPAIPLAIGYRWDLGNRLNLGIEYMYRLTFFDYLDGVSGKYISKYEFNQHLSEADAALAVQVADKEPYFNNALPNPPGTLRGNPGNNDSYSSFNITLMFKVPIRHRIWWQMKQY